ncbi:MAG TPA: rhomboid family intramembrane serine protease [Candidatus Acidoferrum sp.]|nr:rhomboid family intramembrane serine protease [Candidatus Acidoferrum sp.]
MSVRRCATCGKEFELRFGDTATTVNCPTCDLQQWEAAQAPLAPQASAAAIDSPSFPITIGLIAINALVFAVMVLRGVSALDPTPQDGIAFGADFGPLTFGGQWWRLVTSMFVHFGAIHIGLNMWCLWNLGRAAERLMGRASYLLAYFVSGIFSSIASVYWNPMAASAGASGAIFGLAGVLVSYVYLKKTPSHLQINKNMLGSLGTFIFFNLVYGAARPGISNAAHLGGLVMGLVVGAVLPAAGDSDAVRRTRLSIVAIVSAVALTASALGAQRLRSGVGELASIQELIYQHKSDEAIAKLEELTTRQPQLASAQFMLSSLYFKKGQYQPGISALEKACAADPQNLGYQQQLGGSYITAGQFDKAVAIFQKVVQEDPNNARGFLGFGYAYMGLQKYDLAISEFRQAAALDAKSPGPQYALGQAQLKAGRYAEAQETYRQMVAQFPNDPRARAALDYASRQASASAP